MKKISLISIAIIAVVFMNSCKKTNDSKQELFSVNNRSVGWGLHRSLVRHIPDFNDIYCTAPPLDCWDDIVVRYNTFSTLNLYCQANNSEEYFRNENWKDVFQELSLEHYQKLINGDEKIIILKKIIEGKIINNQYIASIVSKDFNEKILLSYPIIVE